MTQCILPSSDQERLTFMKICQARADLDKQYDRRILRGRTHSQLDRLLAQFQAVLDNNESTKKAQADRVQEANRAFTQLRYAMSQLWTHVGWEYRAKRVDSSIVVHYGMSADGNFPVVRSREDMLTVAKTALEGNEATRRLGYRGFSEISSLRLALETAQQANDSLVDAKKAHQKAINSLRQLRQQVVQLARDVRTELRYGLQHEDPEVEEGIMRRYGLRFKGDSKLTNWDESVTPRRRRRAASAAPATSITAPMSKQTTTRVVEVAPPANHRTFSERTLTEEPLTEPTPQPSDNKVNGVAVG